MQTRGKHPSGVQGVRRDPTRTLTLLCAQGKEHPSSNLEDRSAHVTRELDEPHVGLRPHWHAGLIGRNEAVTQMDPASLPARATSAAQRSESAATRNGVCGE